MISYAWRQDGVDITRIPRNVSFFNRLFVFHYHL